MKTILLTSLLILSCSHGKDEPKQSDLDRVKQHRDEICKTFDPSTVTRCDRVTFVALAAAACGRDYNLASYEENGKWNRDTQPCYPADSKSECSLDGILHVSLWAATVRDRPLVSRLLAYLEGHKWTCGEGPEEITNIRPLESVLRSLDGAGGLVAGDSLLGFRGHLIGSYLWLKRKVYGSNTVAEKVVINGLLLDTPRSPLYAALAGDRDGAVKNLMSFPVPYSQYWGSAPDDVIFAASVAVLENR